MPLDWFMALRFLREARTQTLLIVTGVGVGVGVLVFLSALIDGLQQSLVDKTLGSQAHIVVRPPEEAPRSLLNPTDAVVASRIEQRAQRVRSIDDWQKVERALREQPGVVATAPIASGPAFAVRGNASQSVALFGVDPKSFTRVIPVADRIVAGRYSLTGTEALVGSELASDLGLDVGDKLRLEATGGRAELFTVRGVFDFGKRDVNRRWVFVPLRSAQTLLDLVGGASHIEVRVEEIFSAESIAEQITAQTGLIADSWMRTNRELLVGLRSQSSSSTMIQVFVIVAVAMGIASVLIVSVVQKTRQIGILRAMGTPRGHVLGAFLIQGALVGLAGSVVGVALGATLAAFFQTLAVNPDGSPTFPVALTPMLIGRSVLIALVTGVLAAALPARRAAAIDPAEAIRHE